MKATMETAHTTDDAIFLIQMAKSHKLFAVVQNEMGHRACCLVSV